METEPGRKRRSPQPWHEPALELARQTTDPTKVAKLLTNQGMKIGKTAVRELFLAAGVLEPGRPSPRMSKDKRDAVEKGVLAGWSPKELAEEFEVDEATVRRIAYKLIEEKRLTREQYEKQKAQRQAKTPKLEGREAEVDAMGRGFTLKEKAKRLGVSSRTVSRFQKPRKKSK